MECWLVVAGAKSEMAKGGRKRISGLVEGVGKGKMSEFGG